MRNTLRTHLPDATMLTKAVIAGLVSVLSATAVIALVLGYLSATGRLNSQISPIEYAFDEVRIDVPVCPGDVLAWTERYTGKDASARASRYYEIRNMNTGDKWQQGDGVPTGNYFVVPGDVGKSFSEPVSYTVPANMPSGNYVYWQFSQAIGRRAATYPMYFEVKQCG